MHFNTISVRNLAVSVKPLRPIMYDYSKIRIPLNRKGDLSFSVIILPFIIV